MPIIPTVYLILTCVLFISIKWPRCYSVDNVVSYDHACNTILARTSNVIDNNCVNNSFSDINNVHSDSCKILFKTAFVVLKTNHPMD